MTMLPKYVLITPARNEAQFIQLTLQSMVKQTLRPLKWVIVSDGSTDGTDEIVGECLLEHDWIELLRMPERAERHFAGKVCAFNAGYERVKGLDFDIVGNLDADVSFEPDHFEFLIGKMSQNPELGLAGAPFREGEYQYDYRVQNIENVWGGCQLFRRECYESIGGYCPVKGGGVDHIAVISARMKGWKTRTFTEKVCIHHRRMNSAGQSALKAKFKMGAKDYLFGNHPVWELFRTAYQAAHPPLFIGGLALGTGYFWSLLRRTERSITPDLIAFTRREQMRRLRSILTRAWTHSPNLKPQSSLTHR